MIGDSIPWREELLKVADRLERRKLQKRWTERTGFLVERDVMVSAYAIRKLVEARKLSDTLVAKPVTVRRHVLNGKIPDNYDRYEFWEAYDLDAGSDVEIPLAGLCNQIIHSWVWALSATEANQFDGLFVSSDRERRRYFYFIDIDMLIDLFRTIGSEDIVKVVMKRQADGQMVIAQVLSSTDPDGEQDER